MPISKRTRKIKCDYGDRCPGHASPTDRPCGWNPQTAERDADRLFGRKPGEARPADRHKHPLCAIRVPADVLDSWREAAAAAGETLTDWLREAASRRYDADRHEP